jgi:hypothetical protein
MASCSVDGDCRGGYTCQDLSGKPNLDGTASNALGAVLADNTGNGKVCAAKAIGTAPELHVYDAGSGGDGTGGALASNGVCSGIALGGASGGAAGVSGDAGAGGASGASNDAGAGG